MKTLKKIYSMLLCAALLLSSAPILNFSLFRTDAAVSVSILTLPDFPKLIRLLCVLQWKLPIHILPTVSFMLIFRL